MMLWILLADVAMAYIDANREHIERGMRDPLIELKDSLQLLRTHIKRSRGRNYQANGVVQKWIVKADTMHAAVTMGRALSHNNDLLYLGVYHQALLQEFMLFTPRKMLNIFDIQYSFKPLQWVWESLRFPRNPTIPKFAYWLVSTIFWFMFIYFSFMAVIIYCGLNPTTATYLLWYPYQFCQLGFVALVWLVFWGGVLAVFKFIFVKVTARMGSDRSGAYEERTDHSVDGSAPKHQGMHRDPEEV
jgi:hypothetical protein